MQISILKGVYAGDGPDIRAAYPVNLYPVVMDHGISGGYLRPAEGMIENGSAMGVCRGGINWNGTLYRVIGTKLYSISESGDLTEIGDVGGFAPVTFAYSFDRLAISSGGNLYYWDKTTLTMVSDSDLGVCLDIIWVDGYFMSTDGTSLVVTELTDPTSINPLKYGSSEADPDPIKAILKLRNEVYALNRHTIEVFENIGSDNFPFQRVESAFIDRGTIGTHTCAIFMDSIAFLGGGTNEPPSICIGLNGQVNKLSTSEIDRVLSEYSEDILATCVMESRTDFNRQLLYLHLPDKAVVYDGTASQKAGEPIWFILSSGLIELNTYRARYFVWCYGKWCCSDTISGSYGYLTDEISSHWGDDVAWAFQTQIIYNEGKGALFNSLELVAVTGRSKLGDDPTIWTSYSTDGLTWSQEKARKAGKIGETMKRLVWLQQGHMKNWRIQRFRGTSDAHVSFARLEAELEPLNV